MNTTGDVTERGPSWWTFSRRATFEAAPCGMYVTAFDVFARDVADVLNRELNNASPDFEPVDLNEEFACAACQSTCCEGDSGGEWQDAAITRSWTSCLVKLSNLTCPTNAFGDDLTIDADRSILVTDVGHNWFQRCVGLKWRKALLHDCLFNER